VRERAAIFVLFASIALLFSSFPTWIHPGGDARGYLGTALALAKGGTVDLRAAGVPFSPSDTHLIHGANDEVYTIFPLGQSLVLIPLSAAGLWIRALIEDPQLDLFVFTLSHQATAALLYALAILLLYMLLVDHFSFSRPLSFVLCSIYALGSMAFPYSKSIYAEPLQAALLVAIFYLSLCTAGRSTLPLISTCFSLLVLSKPVAVVYAPALAWLLWDRSLWQKTSKASIAVALCIAAGLALVLFAWNYVRNGNVFDNYGGFQAYSVFDLGALPERLYSLLGSGKKNLFLYSPPLLLALPGFALLRDRRYQVAFWGIAGLNLLVYGTYTISDWGAFCWGPRYWMPLVVLFMPYVGVTLVALQRLSPGIRTGSYAAIAILLAAGLYVQVLGASYSWFHTKHVCDSFTSLQRQLGAEPVACDGHAFSGSDVMVHHYLFWNGRFEHKVAGTWPELPWVAQARSPTVASLLFRAPTFGQLWLRKDYLFGNLDAIFRPSTRFVATGVMYALVALACVSLAIALRSIRRHPNAPVASADEP
jgi:hypothetical protein